MTPRSPDGADSQSNADLIAAARRQAERLGDGSASPGVAARGAGDGPPAALWRGRYQNLREFGRGGQGIVYTATQAGTKRTVAIKVLRDGPFTTPRDRARFEREVEILGGLRHPSIVTVIESGCELGCDYVVMDFIPGEPLDAFVRKNAAAPPSARGRRRDALRGTIELFARVCDAVNAAHLAGVVHRDLKPSNVRVTPDGAPYVLDFGLAKSTRGASDGSSAATETGQFLGTLPYASPEQAAGEPQVDIRTDVYSLGVILYQLLTGRFPYEVRGSSRELASRIASAPPASARGLNPAIGHELETILQRALAKEPERRYQSAGALSADLRRYVANEPIEAKRDSSAYLARKLLARHAALVGAASLLIAIVAVGLTVSLWLWRDAARQRDRAQLAEAAEQQRSRQLAAALQTEGEARQQAESSAAEADEIRDFVLSLFKAADPAQTGGKTLTLREALDRGAKRLLDAKLEERPALRAAFCDALGEAYQSLGAYPEADAYFEQALALLTSQQPEDSEAVLRARLQRVELLVLRGRYDEARSLADGMAETVMRESADFPLLAARHALQRGVALRELGRLDDSEAALDAALRGFIEHDAGDGLLGVANNALAVLYLRQKRYEQADVQFATAHEQIVRAHGPDHPDAATIINNRGTCRFYLGQFAEAEPLFSAAAEAFRRLYGDDHPLTTTAENNRVALLRKLNRPDDAEALALDVLARRQATLEPDHPELATSLNNLGLIYADARRFAEAEAVFREALDIRLRSMPAGHAAIAEARRKVGVALLRQSRFEEAEPLLYEAYCEFSALGSAGAAERDRVIRDLVDLYNEWGRPDDAAAWSARRGSPA
ncbi:Serine/threonine-protein kinase StkP [Phycisphaerae bacterium RAS1]|nr:Serine/threonine-protein kinase StkP [Phycisphaerae bacterium RAS1]